MHRAKSYARLLRRKLSRGHWFSRLLRLSVPEGRSEQPGLVLIQVDGLSHELAGHAMRRGKMRFLRHLVEREDYHLHPQYAGLPSSTPAVQAELFYGVKTAVPAFGFVNRHTQQVERMYEPAAATRVQQLIEDSGAEGLLRGGSAYSDNFTGGAALEESHFCAPSLGWQQLLTGFKPLTQGLLILTHIPSLVRVTSLAVLEFFLALWDFCRGVSSRHDLLSELKFIPTRVGISVVLREICVLGAMIDINRGLPIIHMNFLGYDEQAHRRGPRSQFALGALGGIDYAIKRIWREAMRAGQRNYEVWVYSDHGQSSTTPYSRVAGYSIREAVSRVVAAHTTPAGECDDPAARDPAPFAEEDTQCLCALHRGEPGRVAFDHNGGAPGVEVVGMGPVGFVYFRDTLETETLLHVAEDLVTDHAVPAVIVRCPATGRMTGVVRDRPHLTLPGDTRALCGSDHPFADYFGQDLERLCRHEHAGELTLLGWREGIDAVTFAREHGSHGGLTPTECTAFALLPTDAPLATHGPGSGRAADLRRAAQVHLGRRKRDRAAATRPPSRPAEGSLRIMTYNTHACVGTDGRLAPERIARVIARLQPDVVALQEIDVGRRRSGGEHQAERIADYLQMAYHFHPALEIEEEAYGNAILSRFPMQRVHAGALPRLGDTTRREPRGALWVSLDVHGQTVQVINTHFGLSARERLLQANHLLGEEWLGQVAPGERLVLCGDFNALPASRPMRRLRSRLADVQRDPGLGHRPRATFHSRLPSVRIDHILVEPQLQVEAIHIPRSALARAASDHLPLVADLTLGARERQERE